MILGTSFHYNDMKSFSGVYIICNLIYKLWYIAVWKLYTSKWQTHVRLIKKLIAKYGSAVTYGKSVSLNFTSPISNRIPKGDRENKTTSD